MKKLLSPTLLFLAMSAPAFASEYGGTIIETITSIDPVPDGYANPYHVGEKFYGNYSYTSDSIDGTFYTSIYEGLGPTNTSLSGILYIPQPIYGLEELDLQYDEDGGWITVTNGELTDFESQLDHGGIYSVFSGQGFFSNAYDVFGDDGQLPEIVNSGSVTYSNPLLVPDSTSTIWAVLAACSLIAWGGSKRRAQS